MCHTDTRSQQRVPDQLTIRHLSTTSQLQYNQQVRDPENIIIIFDIK